MLYSEFVTGTGCKDTQKNYQIYKNLEIMYMNSDMSKQEIYEYGKKLVDNSKTDAEIEAEEKIGKEIEELKKNIEDHKKRIETLKESIKREQEYLKVETDDGWKKYHKSNISWWKQDLKQQRQSVKICNALEERRKTMEKKAKFIKALYDRNPLNKHAWEHTDLLYEYKGHQYIVTKHNNGYAFDSLRKQHEEEQRRIDEMIEHENDSIPEWKYEGSAQEGLDVFWNYVEGNEKL